MKRKRNPIKWWAVPFLVIGAFVAVAGVTGLVMYLSGALDEQIIEPSDISFSSEVDGKARYDSSTEDSSGSYGTYYTSSDFSIVISTSTADVTAKNVTLSLNGGTTTSDGYITNGVITVPQTVQIGTAFTVSLVTDENDIVVGGISSITARSENSLAKYKTVYVAVDVPASSFELEVVDTEADSDGAFEVIEGTTFSVNEIFSPTKAKMLYSDSSETKEVFYTFNGDEYITMTDSENGVFTADAKTSGATVTITAYTFTTAYAQEEFLEKYSYTTDRDTLTRLIEGEISENSDILSSTITIKVVEVTVKSLTISDSLTFSVTADKTFSITANSSNGNGSLGAVITDTDNTVRSSLLSNVGILIDGFTQYTLSGGLIMRVATDGTITQVTSVSSDNATYYYLPNTSIAPKTEYGNYYWTFATTSSLSLANLESLDVTVYVNYFYKDDNGVWQSLFDTEISSGEMPAAAIDISTKTETPAAWADTLQIKLEITYDTTSGDEIAASVLLPELLSTSTDFASNTYQTIKYFFVLSSDAATAAAQLTEISSIFNVASAYETYSTDYLGNSISYCLLEILDDHLIASQTSSSTFSIVAVTVRTDANGAIVAGSGTNKYQIVNISTQKEIVITSALSVVNMSGSYIALNNETAKYSGGAYYMPYVFYDTDGTKIDQITFVLNLVQKSQDDVANLSEAISSGALTLQVLSTTTSNVVSDMAVSSWSSVITQDSEGKTLTDEAGNTIIQCTAIVTITEKTFTDAASRAVGGLGYSFQIAYNNGTKTDTKPLSVFRLDEDGGLVETESVQGDVLTGASTLMLYYPEPTTITTGYQDLVDKEIEVKVKSGSISIAWNEVAIAGIDVLNDYFVFDIVDQFGNYILSEGVDGSSHSASNLFDVKFVEDGNSSIIGLTSSGKQIKNFAASSGETETSLSLFIVDINDSNSLSSADEIYGDSLTLTFNVESEGLSKVLYDTSTAANVYEVTDDDAHTASNMGSITVKKYVLAGTSYTINLTSLFKVFVGSDLTTAYTNYEIHFSDTYTSTSATEDLSKMFYFNNGSSNTLQSYLDGSFSDPLTQITFNSSFGVDTTLHFVITDTAGLFEIELEFVCLAAGSIGTNFASYATQSAGSLKYGDFLPTYTDNKTTYISVFADEIYELSKYLPITSLGGTNLEWTADASVVSDTGYFSCYTSGSVRYLKIAASNSYAITINTAGVYSFTIYYNGVASSYNIHTTVTLYVVPNVLVEESDAYFDLSKTSNSGSFETTNTVPFTFYKATEYIAYLAGTASKPSVLTTSDWAGLSSLNFYAESGLLLNISYSSGTFIYSSLADNVSQTIELGGSLQQTYVLMMGTAAVQAVRVAVDDDGNVTDVITTDETDGSTILTVEIGLGTAKETLDLVFGSAEQVVEFDGTKILLGSSDTLSIASDNFRFTGYSGSVSYSGTVLSANQVSKLSSGTVTIIGVFNNNFRVTFTVDVLINFTGSNLVLYSNGSGAFNTYGSVTFEDLTALNMSDADAVEVLAENDVYENLEAGATYTLVYKFDDQATYKYGMFYVDSTGTTASLSCVDVLGILASDGSEVSISVADLISISGDSVTINNLSSSYACAYATFKLVVTSIELESTTYYYRIKIEPNFISGSVQYPISSSAEYLDTDSEAYSSGTYTIALTDIIEQNALVAESGLSNFEQDVTYYVLANNSTTLTSVDTSGSPNSGTTYYHQATTTFSRFVAPTSLTAVTGLTEFDSGVAYYVLTDGVLTAVDTSESPSSSTTYYRSNSTGTISEWQVGSVSITMDDSTTTITTGYSTYVAVDIKGNTLTITPQAGYTDAKFEIVIVAKYEIDGLSCLGGDLSYTFIVNGSKSYSSSSISGSSSLTLSGTTYALEVAAGSTVQTLSVSIFSGSGNAYTSESVTALIEGDDSFFQYVAFDGSNLYVGAPSSVSENATVTVSFCSSEKAVLKLVITFTSFYSYTLNTNFSGGTRYAIFDSENTESSLFTALSSSSTQVSTVTLSLKDATLTTDQFGASDGTLLDDLWTATGTDTTSYIEFAHLLEDTDFTFVCVINQNITNAAYTFTFTITVKASFSTSVEYSFSANSLLGYINDVCYDDGTVSGLYGGLTYTYTISNIQAQNSSAYAIQSSNLSVFAFSSTDNSDVENEITPQNYSVETNVTTSTPIYVYFNGSVLFSFTVTIKYKALPSVSITPNYPVLTSGELEAEYINVSSSTSTPLSFVDTADFAEGNRLVITSTYSGATTTSSTSSAFDGFATTLSISSINNATVRVAYTNLSEVSLSSTLNSTDGRIENAKFSTIGLTFSLSDTTQTSGSVTFAVTICGVTATYTVQLITSEVVQLKINSPTSTTSGYETIYAEDLAGYKEATIFAQDRLISFTSATAQTYTFKFFDGTNTYEESEKISVEANTATIVDLGKSFSGWQIYSVTVSGDEYSVGTDEYSAFFTTAPSLTSRVVAIYANVGQVAIDNAQMTFANTNYWSSAQTLSSFNFTYEDSEDGTTLINTDETLALSITFAQDGTEATTTYSIMLTTDIQVTDNATMADSDTSLPAYAEIDAGKSINLMDSSGLANTVEIKNKSGTIYTESLVSENNATILLQTYGFEDLEVLSAAEGGDTYQVYAYNIDNYLKSNYVLNENGNSVIYSTGITPRYGMALNTNSGDITSNYITYEGNVDSDTNSNTNYNIKAQGASNDGNFVLLRLTYTISLTISGSKFAVNSVFNILVRVNPTVTAQHKTSATSSYQNFTAYQQYDTDYTVASNKDNPYTIDLSKSYTNPYVFSLTTTPSNTTSLTDKDAVISTTASSLTATRQASYVFGGTTYNNSTEGWAGAIVDGVWTINSTTSPALEGDNTTAFTSVSLSTDLVFGSQQFKITLVDGFGYVFEFYFTLVSTQNPTISSTTLTEGSQLYFYASGVKEASLTTSTEKVDDSTSYTYYEYETFEYDISNGIQYIVFSGGTVERIILSTTLTYDDTVYYLKDGATSATSVTTKNISITCTITGNLTSVELSTLTCWTYNGYSLYSSYTDESNRTLFTLTGSGTMGMYVYSGNAISDLKVYISKDTSTSNASRIYLSYKSNSTIGMNSGFASASNAVSVAVSGLSVYAFDSTATIFDSEAAVAGGFASIAQYLTIESIAFYYETGTESILLKETESNDSDILSLNTNYKFLDKDGVFSLGATGTGITVPTIAGIYYDLYGNSDGTIDTTMYVTMKYTLQPESGVTYYTKSGDNYSSADTSSGFADGTTYYICDESGGYVQFATAVTTVIKVSNVTVQHSTFDVFAESTISDGNAPVVKSDWKDNVYNDTLEIDLDAGESVTLAVTSTQFEAIYVVTSDTTPDSTKTYYTFSNSYTPVTGDLTTFDSQTTYYEFSGYGRCVVTTDTTMDLNKTYYVLSDNGYGPYSGNSFDSGKTYYELSSDINFITLTNDKDYAVTEYVSISQTMINELEENLSNLTSSSKFQVLAIGTDASGAAKIPSIRYAESDLITESSSKVIDYYLNSFTDASDGKSVELKRYSYDGSSELTADSALTVEIPSIAELSSDNTMATQLFFIVSASGTTYQLAKTFTVQTKFTSAAASTITIEQYYSVSNGNSTFYVAPFSTWASSVMLTGLGSAGTTSTTALASAGAEKFTFKIADAAGSAYIDENGTITTTTNYGQSSETFEVEVYMNTSGADGLFQEHNTQRLLGTLTLSFSDAASKIDSDSITSSGTYVLTNSNSETIVTIPSGYSLYVYSTSTASLDVDVENAVFSYVDSSATSTPYDTKLSVALGGTIDFSSVMASSWSSWTNVAYHIISENGTPVTGIETDTHTFTTQGERTVNVLVAGYGYENDVYGYMAQMVSVTVVVYNNSSTATTEVQTYAVDYNSLSAFDPREYVSVGSLSSFESGVTYYTYTDGSYSAVDDTSGAPEDGTTYYVLETWYEIDSSTGTAKTTWSTGEFVIGYNQKTYFVATASSGTTTYKIVTLNLFVYGSTETAEVVISTNGTFTLSNLDSSATFYACENWDSTTFKMDKTSAITTDKISASGSKQYLAVSSSGTVLWTVNFKVVKSMTAEATYGAYVQSSYISVGSALTSFDSGVTYYTYANGEYSKVTDSEPTGGTEYFVLGIANSEIYSAIESVLSGELTISSIQSIGTGGVLSSGIDNIITDAILVYDNLYFVTYSDNSTAIISMNFYVYSSPLNLGTFYAPLSMQFDLSGMNSQILSVLDLTNTSTITYYTISDASLVTADDINLQTQTSAELFVGVINSSGTETYETYYLLSVNFVTYQSTTITVASGTTVSDALETKFTSNSAQFSAYTDFNKMDTATASVPLTTEITETITYYVVVTASGESTYYAVKFKVGS